MLKKVHKLLSSPRIHVIYPFVLVLVLLIAIFGTVGIAQVQQQTRSKADSNCTVDQSQLTTKSEEQQLFNLINDFRQQNGLAILKWDDTYKRPAAWLSDDNAKLGISSHTDSLSRTPDVRLADCDINVMNGYGETIESGMPRPQEAMDWWKNSSVHREIILTPKFTKAAVSMSLDSSGTKAYWVAVYGGEASNTTQPTIDPTIIYPTTPIMTQPVTTPYSDPDQPNQNEPTSSLQPTSTNVADDMQVSVKVKFSGIGKDGNVSPKNLSRKVEAQIFGPKDEKPITTGTGFLKYDGQDYFVGVIRLGKLNEGTYFIKLRGELTLLKLVEPEFQKLSVDKVNELPAVTLIQGDLNADNVLDINDFALALACFQQKKCATAQMIDFNDDGNTDVADYNLFLRSFGTLKGR